MKPLPTLTKPLRSVDIATREPAQALRERTDSCVVPAAGRGGGGDAGDRAGRRLPRQVRRRPHRRRAAPRSRAYEERIGWTRRPDGTGAPRLHRLHGRRQDAGARAAAGGAGRAGASTPTRCSSSGSGSSIEDYFASHGERGVPRAEEEPGRRAARARRPAPVLSLGGGALGSERVRERSRATPSCCSTSTPTTAWRARRRRRARWRATASASTRCTPSARRSTRRWPTRSCSHERRETVRRALPARCDAHARPARQAAVGRRRRPGSYPRVRRRGRARRRASGRSRGRRFLRHRRGGRRRCYAAALGELRGRRSRCRRARRHKTLATAERVLRALARARAWPTTTTWSRSAAAWSATSPASAPRVYQRGVRGRPGADHARRPGRLGLRRQDRRRPARRARTTSAPTTSRAAVLADPRALATLPAAGAARPAGPRWSRPR